MTHPKALGRWRCRAFLFLSLPGALGVAESVQKQKSLAFAGLFDAEREGFEPPDPFRSSVFKTDAIDHSAISPLQR